uniref:Poly [ADP-ribose] polymerase 14-like n=1 Tax=Saccoglossus kowalevskii TaxID=10224 RepID=A0ABM0MNC0_SACKO|nr:PREDICTED: poly [ADP-ribose] polymerase 14-like [Saccoglossus kowalevskii]
MAATPTSVLVLGLPLDVDDDSANKTIARHFKHPMISSGSRIQFVTRIPDEVAGNIQSEGTKIFLVKFSSAHQALQCDPNLHVLQFDTGLEIKVTVQQCTDEIEQFISTQLTGQQEEVNSRRPHTPVPIPQVQLLSQQDEANSKRPHTPVPIPQVQLTSVNENAPSSGNIHAAGQHHEMQPEDGNPHALHDNPQGSSFYSVQGPQTQVMHEMQQSAWGQPRQMTGHNPGMNHWYMSQRGPMSFQYPQGYQDWYSNWQGYGIRPPQQEWGPYYQQMQGVPPLQPQHYVRHPSNEIFYDHRTNQPYPGVGACQNVTRSPPNTGMTSLTRVDPSIQSKLGRIKPPVPPKPSEIKSQADTTDSEVDPVIKVSGFKRETSTDLLELYFESKKRSGGGPMKSIEMKDDSVHIVFEKSKDAHRFLKQNHALEGAKLTVQVLNTPVVGDVDIGMASQPEDKDYLDSAIIDVTGFGSDVNMETVELYLENKRRSGGGPILEKFQDRKGVLTIVYENAAIAERVLKRPMHTVGGISLTVAKGRKRRKVVTDNKCILIKGFSDETTKEDLVLYLENRSGIEEEPVLLFGEKPGVVMARYSQNISDVNKAVTAINSRPLKRSVLTAEPVLVTSTIIASNLPPNVSEDILELYFESKRNGEGDVEEIKLDVEKKLAIISFQDSEAIDQILQRKSHTIHKQLITVNPYYEFLGVMVSSDGPIPQQPNPISKDVNQDITVYIMNRGEYATELRNQLNDLHTKIEWPYGGHNNMVCLSSNIPDHLENKRQFIKDWPKKVVSILDEHLNKFKCITKSIPKDIWNQVIGQTEELDIGDSSVEYISESMELKITGTLENVDNLETQFKNVITDIEEKLRKANETITETREIKKVQMQQLIMVQFNETVAQQFPELNFHLSVDESQLHFIGLPHDIMSCRILLYETLGALPVAKLEPPNPFYVEFLNSADVSAILHSMLNDKDLRAMYLIADNEIVVSARDKPQLKQAVNIIHTSITDVNITVDDESLPGIHQQDWEKLVVELEEQNVCRIRTDLEGQCITIITFQSTIKCIRKEVDHYIKVNTIVEYNIQSDRGRIRFAFDHKKDDVVSLETGKYQPLKINKCLESLVINIKGTKDDVESARERMTNLLDVIQIRQYVIDKPGMSKLFREEKGKNYIQSVEKAFACKIEINDPSPRKLDRVAGKTTRKSLVPGYRMLCQHTKPNGMKIQVGLGDMTVLNVDVIVNAANCHLKHVGGLAKAIIDAGGLEIQDECDKIIERRGDLKVGETVSTGAGNLPCKLIIHTVGPIWSGSKYKKSGSNETQEEKSLTNSVINSLQEATSRKCTTIAIPAISSGVFGFPVDLCVHTIVKAVDSFCELNQNHSLKEIRLVDNSVITCDQFKDAMIDMYGKDSMSYGVDTFPGILTIPKMDKVETSRMKTKVPSGGFIPTTLAFEVTTVEGKTIKLIKGNISAQKADIIVNTTFATLDLNCAVSKAILLAAGNNLQKEIDALKADGTKRKNGDIVITAGAQLSCKKVYHIICDKWTGDQVSVS